MKAATGEFDETGDILIIPIFEDTDKAPNNTTTGLGRGASIAVKAAASSEACNGKVGNSLSVWTKGCPVIFVGVGKQSKLNHKGARDAGAKCLASLSKDYGTNIVVRFTSGWKVDQMAAFTEGMILRDYAFDKYQNKDEDDDQEKGPWSLVCQAGERHLDELKIAVERSSAIATGVHLARDLGNEPANRLYPEEFGRRALEWADGKENAEVEVWDYKRLQKEGMHGLIAVGKGSIHKPCMVFFRLNSGAQKGEQVPCIVGKGITFDSGGISIKGSAGMDEMKLDMHGAATVFGLFQALYATGYKGQVNGIACMAENMPSAEAYRPGDVIETYSGKTIEVLNTDAEGRNVLADGLWKAGELNPSYIIDLATLTGSIVVALGHEATGLFSNDSSLSKRLQKAGDAEDEIAWPMPLLPAFEKQMTSSKIADVRNQGKGRWGGASQAAGFLKQFVQERTDVDGNKSQIPWAHLDIAGTAGIWASATNSLVGHGATGIQVRALHRLITQE
jgi:leucyl aminopeptidase